MHKSIQQMILALGLAVPAVAGASVLSADDAKIVAAEFFQYGKTHRLADKDALSLVHVATDATSKPVSYVFNATDGQGFVIVSADDTSMPVIAYSTTSTWCEDMIPQAAEQMLSVPVSALSYGTDRQRSARLSEGESRVLETPSWSQEAPFNNNIPNRRLTGCVGVALAEILKYHSYPATRPASLVKEGEDDKYAWETMRSDNYRSGYSMEEAEAVAALVADAAIAIGTDFGMSSSSAFEVKVPYALTSMFGYDSGVSYKKRAEMDKASWEDLIVNEINEGRPVLYCGQDVSSGHAFVCDGYEFRGGKVYLRINWGWGGSANGYYASDALNPVVSRAHSYNDLMTVVYNIKPAADVTMAWSPVHITSDERQPGLTLDVEEVAPGVAFNVRAGALKNISDRDFNGQLAVALYGADGKLKALLNDGRNFKLLSLQTLKYADFSCKLPAGVSVAEGDVVRMATKASDSDSWLPVAGDLLARGDVPALGAQIPYFNVSIPSSTEDVEIVADDNKVIKGRDFAFKVTPKSTDKVITVKANGFILSPDASNGYKITNVVEDQNIDILVQNAADVLSKSVLWVEAGTLQDLLTENEAATVVDLTLFGSMNANDFAFIRDRMKLNRLDISQVYIAAVGSNPANAIPAKAFSGYRSLKTIILPSNITTFKSGCFNNTGLTSIEIPASVATYEYNIFVGCSALREVIVRRPQVAWVNWCVFEGTPKARLVVPVGASGAYKAKEYWQDFKEIVEENPVPASTYRLSVKEEKGLKFTALTEGTEFALGSEYSFTLETDDSFGDAGVEVYANNTRLYPAADGTYNTRINTNTLIHVKLRQPESTTPDTTWKITGDAGGIGLVTDVVNVPVGKSFTVRANAIKVPAGNDASKFFCMVLTDKDGGIKEFISPITPNSVVTTGNLTYNFSCQVNESIVKEGNELRLATSYNKKNWNLVNADAEGVTDRISAIGNKVIYHSISMPQTMTGAKIEGAATQIVRGMPLNFKVTPVMPSNRVTLAVNGVYKALSAAVANISIPAVTEDIEVTILIHPAGESDYVVVNVQEGELAAKIAECPDRLKVIGTILDSEFSAFRAHAGNIIDLDLADLTIKGSAMNRNAIPSNAFAPTTPGGSSALRSIILPQNLERISDNAFARCSQLKEVTIPASVTYVGSGAFSSCTALTKIVMVGSTPPLTGTMSPFPSDASKITLEVPRGSESAYGAATFWSTIGPKAAKVSYWLKYDPTRAFVYTSYYGDGSNIEVSNSKVQVSLGLPNCPYEMKSAGVYRSGVIFKLYDNGKDVFTYSDANSIKNNFAPNEYGYGGQYNVIFDPSLGSSSYKYPQNHTFDVVFFYPVTFQNLDGANDVKAEIVNLQGDDRYDAQLSLYTYGAKGNRVVYKEGKDYKFRLTPPSPNVALTVQIENKIMTRAGTSARPAEYEWKRFDAMPDQDGLYTIPALPGDTWVKITGYLHVEEGEPIPSEDLTAVRKEDVEDFSELAVTGNMDEAAFQAVRDKFESIETLDLSEIENETLPDNAFEGMENLHTVILPDNVTEIGAETFKDCENLESIIVPGVSSIGDGAFEGCTSLTSIILPATTASAPEGAPARSPRASAGITAESFRGINPNCIIYVGDTEIPDSDHLNIILNVNGHRVAASDIILDAAHPFNAPASFSLGDHRISFATEIPGSNGNDVDGGWKGIMLPFTPTDMEYGVEFDKRNGSGLALISFDDENSEAMTHQTSLKANRPYMAHVCAPFESVPVTFFADGQSEGDNFVYDVAFTPVPEENVAIGKNFSLYGSYDGDSRLGDCLTLDETAGKFVMADSTVIRPFDAYLCANEGVSAAEFTVGSHPLWIHNPESAGVSGTYLYRSGKIELVSATAGASIYYTLDGSDPADAEGSRILYTGPFPMTDEALTVMAMAEYKGYVSDNVTLEFQLKKAALDYALAANWNWISHNVEKDIDVAEFAGEGISRILSQTQEVVRDPKAGLVGNLKTLAPVVTYKVCVDGDEWNTRLEGVAFDPSASVALHRGWNWIGCPVDADASLRIEDLFADLAVEEGDMIVGLEGYSQADAEGEWKGTLSALAPGSGYMYFSNSDKEFTYTLTPAAEEPVHAQAPAMTAGEWVADIHRYPSVMPVTAMLVDGEGTPATSDDYELAAFCGDECRGTGVNIDGVFMINVHGNTGDKIEFRFITPEGVKMISSTKVNFDENPAGTLAEPCAVSLSGTTAADVVAADSFVIITENGSVVLKGDLSEVLAVEIYDIAGNKVAAADAANGHQLSVDHIETGVHILVIRTTEGNLYDKVMIK
ncbi:MAG: C10 family peptidase [Muribaculaceae bacterium]|nr:C10 family peptidase [Muribaculaceae bacterium]